MALSPFGYLVRQHGYDWRLDVAQTGGDLAQRIRRETPPDNPCSIVAHSLGGLVARLAWRSLVSTGQSGLVRRIVTLGTPHWGSYGAVRIWSLDSELVTQLFYLSLAVGWTGALNGPFNGGHIWSPAQIAALVSSWPSVYWTLPSLLAPDADGDPLRVAIYEGGWPADRGVDQVWASRATGSFQPQLAAAMSMPPLAVMTTVAGTGSPTVQRLRSADLLGSPAAYLVSGDGDGQVASSSAWLDMTAQLEIMGAHGDLPVIASGIGGAADVILAERPPPAPIPPIEVVPGVWQQIIHGPPLARPANWFIDC
jgi:hypothetical protein